MNIAVPAEVFGGDSEQVDELALVGVVHEHFDERLDEPRALVVVPHGGVPGNGGVGDDHVLPRRPGLAHLGVAVEGDRVLVGVARRLPLSRLGIWSVFHQIVFVINVRVIASAGL